MRDVKLTFALVELGLGACTVRAAAAQVASPISGSPRPRSVRQSFAYATNQLLEWRKLSRHEAARVLGVSQPKVSALRNYKLAGFSSTA